VRKEWVFSHRRRRSVESRIYPGNLKPKGSRRIRVGEPYTEPYKTLNREMQRTTSKKLLGPRALAWQDAARVLSGVANQLGPYAGPDNT
jgi:hypothetical protein